MTISRERQGLAAHSVHYVRIGWNHAPRTSIIHSSVFINLEDIFSPLVLMMENDYQLLLSRMPTVVMWSQTSDLPCSLIWKLSENTTERSAPDTHEDRAFYTFTPHGSSLVRRSCGRIRLTYRISSLLYVKAMKWESVVCFILNGERMFVKKRDNSWRT